MPAVTRPGGRGGRATSTARLRVKSSLATPGGVTGSALAVELERLGQERRLDGAPAVFASLATEVDRLARHLADASRPAAAAGPPPGGVSLPR